ALERGQGLADHRTGGEAAQAGGLGLLGGNAQRHLLVIEGDHIDFEGQARDLLGFDPDDVADAMRRINDVITDGEIVNALVHGWSSQVLRPAGFGSCLAKRKSPPANRGATLLRLRNSPMAILRQKYGVPVRRLCSSPTIRGRFLGRPSSS